MSSSQTMKTWAIEVKSLEEIPRAFKNLYESLAPAGMELPYTVYAPPYKSNKIKSEARVLFLSDEKLYILTKTKSRIETVTFEFGNIDYVEYGLILLTSWIKIEGTTTKGENVSVTVGFSTVMDELFKRFLDTIRSSYITGNKADREQEKSKFNYLIDKNFKFMNYSKQFLQEGEEVLSNIYEPSIEKQNFKLFGRTFYRRISPAHVLILSDEEIILLEDPQSIKLSDYGATWTFIPYSKIETIRLSPDENEEFYYLTITLRSGIDIMATYRETSIGALEEMKELFLHIPKN